MKWQVLFWYVLSLFFSQLPWEASSIIIPVSYKCRKWDKGNLKKEAGQGPAAERPVELAFKRTVWSQSLYTCHYGIRTCLLCSIRVSGFSDDIWGWSPSPLLRNPTKTPGGLRWWASHTCWSVSTFQLPRPRRRLLFRAFKKKKQNLTLTLGDFLCQMLFSSDDIILFP